MTDRQRGRHRVPGPAAVLLSALAACPVAAAPGFVGAILNVDSALEGIDHTNVTNLKDADPAVGLLYPYAVGARLALLSESKSQRGLNQQALLFGLGEARPAAAAPPIATLDAPREGSTGLLGRNTGRITGFFPGASVPVVQRGLGTHWMLRPLGAAADDETPGYRVSDYRGLSNDASLVASERGLVRYRPDGQTPLFEGRVDSFDIAAGRDLAAIAYRDAAGDAQVCIRKLDAAAGTPCLSEIRARPEQPPVPAPAPSPFADEPPETAAAELEPPAEPIMRGAIYPLFSPSGRYLAVIRETPGVKWIGDLEVWDLDDAENPRRRAKVPGVRYYDSRLFQDTFSYKGNYSWIGERVFFLYFHKAEGDRLAKSRAFQQLDLASCPESDCAPEPQELPACVMYDFPAYKAEVKESGKAVRMVRAAPGPAPGLQCSPEALKQGFVALRIGDLLELQATQTADTGYLLAQVALQTANKYYNDSDPHSRLPETQERILVFRLAGPAP